MQKIIPNTCSKQQQLLNDFQVKSLKLLRENKESQDLFRELIYINSPIDGIITITQPTKNYVRYMKTLGIKLDKEKPIMEYTPLNKFIKDNSNLTKEILLILKSYNDMDLMEKRHKFLFIFQIPYSHNINQSLKNIYIIDNILPTNSY